MNFSSEPTLDDYIEEGLELLSIGLNPSLPSVESGVYFAGKRNRFWRALNGSGLVEETLHPSLQSMDRLLNDYRIGFTDTVKRPTAGSNALRMSDYKRDVPLLHDKIMQFQPVIAWFHGKLAYRHFITVLSLQQPSIEWGEQPLTLGKTVVFVSPNPSPANAVFSLEDLIHFYKLLKVKRDRLLQGFHSIS